MRLTPFQRTILEAVGRGEVTWHPVGVYYRGLSRKGFSPAVRRLADAGLVSRRAAAMGEFSPIPVELTDAGREALSPSPHPVVPSERSET